MASSRGPPNLSDDDRVHIQNLSKILRQLNHRNKNQHRRSIWWRHFSTFRRQVEAFLCEVEMLAKRPATHSVRLKKRLQDEQIQERMARRLSFWKDMLLPQWHRAFLQIIADQRFANLGLLLLAILAQICRIVGVTDALAETVHVDSKEISPLFNRESSILGSGPVPEFMEVVEDHGQVIARDVAMKEDASSTTTTLSPSTKALQPPEKTAGPTVLQFTAPFKKKSKSKPKNDVIDDIFSGLE